MRSIDATIRVETTSGGRPDRIEWDGRVLQVKRLVECWVYQTRWWGGGSAEKRTYYRVQTAAGVLDVYRTAGRSWVLTRIVD